MGRKSSRKESSSNRDSSEESSSENEKKEKKFDDPNEGGSILPCIVVIVVLAIIGGAIYAVIKHVGPSDEMDNSADGEVTTSRPKPVIDEEDVIPIDTSRNGGSWKAPSHTHPTPAPKREYVFRKYPSGACVPVGVDSRTEKTYEWIEDILEYCYPYTRSIYRYIPAPYLLPPEYGVDYMKSEDDENMKGAAFGCSYNLVYGVTFYSSEQYGKNIFVGNFTYDDAKEKCKKYFGGQLAMFESPYELCQVFHMIKELTSDEYWDKCGSHGRFLLDHIKKMNTIWVAGEQWHRTTDGRTAFKGVDPGNLPLVGPFKFIPNQDQSKIGDSYRAGLDIKRRAFIAAPKQEKKMFLCKTCNDVNCLDVCKHHLYPDHCNNGRETKEWWML